MVIKEVYDPQTELFQNFEEVDESSLELSKYGTLPDGYVTDGRGHIYKIPKEGYSKVYTYKDSGRMYRYNYARRVLEYITKDRDVIQEYGLNAGDWCDNPDYWVGYMDDTIQEMVDDMSLEFNDDDFDI